MVRIRVSIPKSSYLARALADDILDTFPNRYYFRSENSDCYIQSFGDDNGNFCMRIVNDHQDKISATKILKELSPILNELFLRLKQLYTTAQFSIEYYVHPCNDDKYMDSLTYYIINPYNFSLNGLKQVWYSIKHNEDDDAEVWYSDISLYFNNFCNQLKST